MFGFEWNKRLYTLNFIFLKVHVVGFGCNLHTEWRLNFRWCNIFQTYGTDINYSVLKLPWKVYFGEVFFCDLSVCCVAGLIWRWIYNSHITGWRAWKLAWSVVWQFFNPITDGLFKTILTIFVTLVDHIDPLSWILMYSEPSMAKLSAAIEVVLNFFKFVTILRFRTVFGVTQPISFGSGLYCKYCKYSFTCS